MQFSSLKRYKGNQALFNLVLMSLVSTYAGEPLHIHAEGLRGTGKTSIMRGARQIMPPITRIKGCIYNCDPKAPHCPIHKKMSPEEIAALGTELIPMPFLEISHSAKIGTVAGSIDISRLTNPTEAEAVLLPGIIPQAHRGIVFIDEINRLADTSPEITDILLDVMGNKPGHIQIEEAGLAVVDLPVSVSIWAASNPDEDPGPLEEIRRQLSDRFDMLCSMERPDSVNVLAEILRDNSFKKRNQAQYKKQDDYTREQNKIIQWAHEYSQAELPDFLINFIARLYLKYNLESLRAIEAMQQGTILYSIINGRKEAQLSDLYYMLPYTIKHRVDSDTFSNITSELQAKDGKENFLRFLKNNHEEPLNPTSAEPYFKKSGTPLKDMDPQQILQRDDSYDTE